MTLAASRKYEAEAEEASARDAVTRAVAAEEDALRGVVAAEWGGRAKGGALREPSTVHARLYLALHAQRNHLRGGAPLRPFNMRRRSIETRSVSDELTVTNGRTGGSSSSSSGGGGGNEGGGEGGSSGLGSTHFSSAYETETLLIVLRQCLVEALRGNAAEQPVLMTLTKRESPILDDSALRELLRWRHPHLLLKFAAMHRRRNPEVHALFSARALRALLAGNGRQRSEDDDGDLRRGEAGKVEWSRESIDDIRFGVTAPANDVCLPPRSASTITLV